MPGHIAEQTDPVSFVVELVEVLFEDIRINSEGAIQLVHQLLLLLWLQHLVSVHNWPLHLTTPNLESNASSVVVPVI